MTPFGGEGLAPAVGLSHPSGARAAVYPDGAHVFTWWPSRQSEVLFVSERAVRQSGVALRGGVPIVFPQFADEGPLPKHGFARTARWEMQPRDTMTELALRLRDDERTRALWPHAFHAAYTVTIDDRSLAMALAVENTGDDAMTFTCALHTYIRVGDVAQVMLGGLQGRRYRVRGEAGEAPAEESERLAIDGPIDRVYFDTETALVLDDPVLDRRISVEAEGFTDTVVWNPGAEGTAAFPDLAPDDYRHFLCVESARIGTPVQLAPGEVWRGRQVLRV